MFKKSVLFLSSFLALNLILYGMHNLLLYGLAVDQKKFQHSLEDLYIGFGSISFLILLILLWVRNRNLELVGNTFMLLTTFKMIGCFALGKYVLFPTKPLASEKWNFFGMFILFLGLETVFTIRFLLQKNNPY